jgi:hypothetical protein
MRKSVIAIAVVVATLGAFGAFAAGSPATAATPAAAANAVKMVSGSVVSIDTAAKSFVLKEGTKDAKEVTVFWGATTKVSGGSLAPGQKVHVSYSEVGGKMEATKVKIEAAAAAAKKQ